jgi:hypothetical protein
MIPRTSGRQLSASAETASVVGGSHHRNPCLRLGDDSVPQPLRVQVRRAQLEQISGCPNEWTLLATSA